MKPVFRTENANSTVRFGIKVYEVKKNPLVYLSKKIEFHLNTK